MSTLNIPSTLPQEHEITLLREYFYESTRHQGFLAKLSPVVTAESNLAHDHTYTYGDDIDIYVLFEEFPRRTVLSKLGWFSESSENQPIAYIPTFYYDAQSNKIPLRPLIGTKLTFAYDAFDETAGDDFRTFMISDLATDSPRVLNWIAKLVPDRDVDSFDVPTEDDDDFQYLNVTEERPFGR